MWFGEEVSGRREELLGANRRNGCSIHKFEKRKTGARVPEPRAPGKVVMGDQWMEGDG